jgi:PHD/YefM family antitoxin component YafN of YafNO toxin-antitoxin module
MNFFSVRDLRTVPKNVWDSLSEKGEVVITNNGKPTALILDISNGNLEQTMLAIKQAQAMIAVNNMREKAAMAGFMSADEIDTEIRAAREGLL